MTSDITVAADTLSTAAHLGLSVGAPNGTLYFYARAAQDGDLFTDEDLLVSSRHSTYESAINHILTYVLDAWDTPNQVTGPWITELLFAGNDNPTKVEIEAARQDWLNNHTDEQILDNYFDNFGTWSVTQNRIDPPHPAPFRRTL